MKSRPFPFFVGVLFAIATFTCWGLAEAEPCLISPQPPEFLGPGEEDRLHALPHPQSAPHRAFHGQGVYGVETVYLSHLAVFMGSARAHPHNFQVILEVEFEDSDDHALYRSDRAQHPGEIYTAGPPAFDQIALVSDYQGRGPLDRLPQTAVFRGHFEQGGERILGGTPLRIRRVVYFREFFLDGAKLGEQSYLLFGKGEDLFLTHLLSAPPDFDQTLSVEFEADLVPTPTLTKIIEELKAKGLYLRLPERPNSPEKRLEKGEVLTCSLETGTRALPIEVRLKVVDEPYCESGEFSKLVTNAFNPQQSCKR